MDSKSKIQPEIIDRQDTLDEYCFPIPAPAIRRNAISGSMKAGISVSKISLHSGCRNSPCRRRLAARFIPLLAVMTAQSR